MRFVYILGFLILSSATFAQVRVRLNYDKNWQLTTPDSAIFIRVCIYDTTGSFFAGPVADLYPSGKPQMKGAYVARMKQGEFISYYENGNVESVGQFENDVRVGNWKYYHENGNEKLFLVFSPGAEDPKVIYLKDEDGDLMIRNGFGKWREELMVEGERIVVTGQYKDSKRDGTWRFYNPKSNKTYVEVFENGKFITGYMNIAGGKLHGNFKPTPQFSLPLKFAVTEAFVARPGIDFTVYPQLKQMTSKNMVIFRRPSYKIYTSIDTTAGFTLVERFATPQEGRGNGWEGFYSYVKNAVRYPAEAKEDKVEGVVLLAYMINEDGTFSDFTVLKSVGSGCDEEAIRIMREYTMGFKWSPAIKDRKPIPQRFELPVKFSLGNDIPEGGNERDRIYTVVDTHAHPDGSSFGKYIKSNMRFPKEAIKRKVSGYVKMEFIVYKDGHLGDFRIITPQGFGFDESAMQVMKEYSSGHKWFPATLAGEHVNEKVVIPLDFNYRR